MREFCKLIKFCLDLFESKCESVIVNTLMFWLTNVAPSFAA